MAKRWAAVAVWIAGLVLRGVPAVVGVILCASVATAAQSLPPWRPWMGTVESEASLIARARASAPPTEQSGTDQQDNKAAWNFRWEDHPELRVGARVRIDFRARVQGDIRRSDAPFPKETDSIIDIARRRVSVEGEIRGLFFFQIERELDGASRWRDVFVNYKQFDGVQVQCGQFKLPFSLEENTSARNLDFVYRSLPVTTLAPGRDVGVMVHGRLVRRVLRYELGLFDHDGSNARGQTSDRVYGKRTLAARMAAQPFRSSKSAAADLQIGVAYTSSALTGEGFSSLRGRSVLRDRFYSSNYLVNGRRHRVGIEARWRPGPFSVKSEYIRATDERLGESVEDTALSPLLASGWYVSGTWALTGGKKADGISAPQRPLFQGGFGAVEVAARIERIRFSSLSRLDDTPSTSERADLIVGNGDRVETVGVNWYPNRWIKLQVNVIRETIDDPRQGPLPSQPSFWSEVFRVQFSL